MIYSYSSVFPHWLLNSFFLFFGGLAVLSVLLGAARYWRVARHAASASAGVTPARPVLSAVGATLRSVFAHDKFDTCERSHSRLWSHSLVFFGFLALTLVTVWVITAEYNPLIRGAFVYPFSFWSPWKVLANLGGLAILGGCFLMIRDRMRSGDRISTGSFPDWALITTLLVVVLTGFFTEVLHYVRLEPHRHIAYFVHLVFVFALLIYLPYSKFAHIVYRTVMLIYAERFGRGGNGQGVAYAGEKVASEE